MAAPMLADFALRLAGGLAAALLFVPWRQVPPAFFRNQCQIILGVAVLGTLDLARYGPGHMAMGLAIAAAVCAFLGSVVWGLGLPRVGLPLAGLIVALLAGLESLGLAGWSGPTAALDFAARLASGLLLGCAFTAMLLGHHYLTAPAMSIQALVRLVRILAASLAVRALLAAAALALALGFFPAGSRALHDLSPFLLSVRWGAGIVGPAVATYLAWKTAAIRSTQSATGILFVGTLFVLFGELTAMVLARQAGILL